MLCTLYLRNVVVLSVRCPVNEIIDIIDLLLKLSVRHLTASFMAYNCIHVCMYVHTLILEI